MNVIDQSERPLQVERVWAGLVVILWIQTYLYPEGVRKAQQKAKAKEAYESGVRTFGKAFDKTLTTVWVAYAPPPISKGEF